MIFEKHANLKYKYGNKHFWCRVYYMDTVKKCKENRRVCTKSIKRGFRV